MRNKISVIPTYSEDGSLVTFIVDKLDGSRLTADEIADCLVSYAALLREPDDELAN